MQITSEWPLGTTNLEHQDLHISTTTHIPVVFPEFKKYPIKVPSILKDPVHGALQARQALKFWRTQLNFAVHCATTALGISAKCLTGSLPLINNIF